jgi:hypothetical protein
MKQETCRDRRKSSPGAAGWVACGLGSRMRFLIDARLVLQPQSAAEEARDQFRSSWLVGVHALTIRSLDTHSARSGQGWLDLKGGAEL